MIFFSQSRQAAKKNTVLFAPPRLCVKLFFSRKVARPQRKITFSLRLRAFA
jgi:hypothetical protein